MPFAHGSDGGGSIRLPAACCGLIGYKPGRGFNLRARAPHADVEAGVRHTARLLAGLGDGLERIEWPAAFGDVIEAFASMWAVLARRAASWMTDPQSASADDLLEPWTIALARSVTGHPTPLDRFFRTLATASQGAERFFARYDVMLCPTVTPPPPTGDLAPTRSYDALRAAIFDFVAYTPLQNLVGLPIGSMLSAARGGDDMLLDLVARLEQAGAWSTAIARPLGTDPT